MLTITEVKRDNGELIKCLECGWVHVTFKDAKNAMCEKCGSIQWEDADPSDYPPDAFFPCVDKSDLERSVNDTI